ncbi:MAG: hypothetical protein AB7D39_02825 [Pseudodesulfovibrio sp.]|uniref:hypothetical protein n=1 Tax=Pseudodesulfovibrio sp. TaxID=2035812 RepID=UPI003D13305D
MQTPDKNPMIPKKSQHRGSASGRGKKACDATGKTIAAGSSAQAFHNNATSKELFTVALHKESIQIPEGEPKSKRGNVQL